MSEKKIFVAARNLPILLWIAGLSIVALAGWLRFMNLRTSPGWYSDEGVFISMAQNLAAGKWQIFGVHTSPLEIQRPPFYLYLLSILFRIWTVDILTLRALSAFCGTLDVLLLFLFVRNSLGNRLALISSGLLAILPWVVSFNRLGFSYNLMAPFFLIAVFSTWKITTERNVLWLIIACATSALAFCTDYLGGVAIGVVLSVCFLYKRRWLLPGLLVITIFASIIILPPVLSNFQASLRDIQFISGSKVSVSLQMQVANLIINYGELFYREGWIILALTGLFLNRLPRLRGIILLAVGTSLLLTVRTFPPVGRGLHYLIHLFPFFALGLAAFLEQAYFKAHLVINGMFDAVMMRLRCWLRSNPVWFTFQRAAVTLLLFLILVNPLAWMLTVNIAQSVYGVNYLFNGNNEMGLSSENDVTAVSAYLNAHTNANNLVLASAQILWAIPNFRQTDWGITAAVNNQSGLMERTLYDCSLPAVRFAVVDSLALGFVRNLDPAMKEIVDQVQLWPLVFKSGDLNVHQNPVELYIQ